MDYLEQAKKEIREDWFKNHKIKMMVGEEGFQRIIWGAPGTGMYQVMYTLSGNMVFITGDIGDAAYSLTCLASLNEIKDMNLGYFTGKLTAIEHDRWRFDEKLAKKELKEYWKEYEMKRRYKDSQEIYDGILSAIDESTSLESYRAWLMPVYQETSIESDDLEPIWDFGKRTAYSVVAYWVGLQMAIEHLEKKEVVTA